MDKTPDKATKPKEFRFQLTEPIEAHGETLREIVIPLPLKARHAEAMDEVQGNTKRVMKLIEVAAGIPRHSVQELSFNDLAGISEDLVPFLERSPKTGGTS